MARDYFSMFIREMERSARRAARDAERQRRLQIRYEAQCRRQQLLEYKESCKENANMQTEDAKEAIKEIENFLVSRLNQKIQFNWDDLKRNDMFPEPMPPEPRYQVQKQEPQQNDKKYKPRIGILELLFRSKREESVNKAKRLFLSDYEIWEKEKKHCHENNTKLKNEYEKALKQREERKIKFEQEKENHNRIVDFYKNAITEENPEAIEVYFDQIIDRIDYPDKFTVDAQVEYSSPRKLIVEIELPLPEDFLMVKQIRYIKSQNEYRTSYLSKTESARLYNSYIHQLCLLVIYKTFEMDNYGLLDSILLNGWVKTINRSSGEPIEAYIISLDCRKEDILGISLEKVDPQMCFKFLKGIGGPKFSDLVPIEPERKLRLVTDPQKVILGQNSI